jgi:hypothetical protein
MSIASSGQTRMKGMTDGSKGPSGLDAAYPTRDSGIDSQLFFKSVRHE